MRKLRGIENIEEKEVVEILNKERWKAYKYK
jgi:hypothetical protein